MSSSASAISNGAASATVKQDGAARSRLRADDLNSQHIDQILSEGCNRPSFEARNEIYEEIHGVANLYPEETPEMLQDSLQQFQLTLAEIPSSKKQSYNKARTSYPDSYLHQTDTQLRFLRAECFDAAKAAARFVKFCDIMTQYFGDVTLEWPICLSDLGKDGMKCLMAGNHQVLPSRDRSGRRVFATVTDFAFDAFFEVRCKVIIYLTWAAMEDIETQRNGMVFVNWPDPTVPLFPERKEHVLGYQIQQAIPVKIAVVHLCLPNTPLHQILKALHALILGKEMRNRLKIVIGERNEIEYHLRSYGIPMDLWPVTQSGNVKITNLFQEMKIRRIVEGSSVTGNENSHCLFGGDTIVECPGSSGILFRSGRSYLHHRGNQEFYDLIALKASEHHAAASKDEKMKITWWIMGQVEKIQARFLGWNAHSGYWVVVEDLGKIRNKIAVYIRDFWRQLNAAKNRQDMQSSTYKFERQDGRKQRRGDNGTLVQKVGMLGCLSLVLQTSVLILLCRKSNGFAHYAKSSTIVRPSIAISGQSYSAYGRPVTMLSRHGRINQQLLILKNERKEESTVFSRQRMSTGFSSVFSTSLLVAMLWVGMAANQPANAFAGDSISETTVMLTTEPQSSASSSQQELLMKSLRPATEDRPQIPLPTMNPEEQRPSRRSSSKYYQNMDSSSTNPQILQALVSLASPRTTRPYGTDILVIKIWSGPPPNYKVDGGNKATNAVLLGGAKLPLAVVGGGGFPLRITLGPQNALDVSQWKEYTQSLPQDLWLEAGVCRSNPTNDDDSTPSAKTSSAQLCPDNTQAVLEGVAVSKWIMLPSAGSQVESIAGVRAPSTVQLR